MAPLPKTNSDIAREWDDIAVERFNQLFSGEDRTYNEVLCPLFVHETSKRGTDLKVADVGCGLGFLTKALSEVSSEVVGVDISQKSLIMAQERNGAENIRYIFGEVESVNIAPVDLCVANMFLMDCLNIDSVVDSISRLIKRGGWLLVSIPNPFFMPRYWGYERNSWFSYNKEIVVEMPFRTSTTGVGIYKTTHVHRPVSFYINALCRHGFELEEYREITGVVIPKRNIGKYPRHLFFVFKRSN
ncbi:class I SAM-dependent methyltransferase [Devosia aquimaris]|uniref:class I SAM-dependent methyltransferase n=1 Tax=Devosia aquimaris TaxID=2866214 RepID=UPI001CD053F1|nr:class I SAM-dependent methyltransferase [Devosia sp. CJK-A8-3]